MRVVVFGANGRCGASIVQALLHAHHDVVAAVRRPETMKSVQGVDVATIDLANHASLCHAIDGCHAVVMALGSNSLKAASLPTTLYSEATRAIRRAMLEVGCRRILVLSSGGVVWDETAPGFYTKFVRRYIVNTCLDMVRMETILEESDLDWTAVRLSFVKDGKSRPLRVKDELLDGGFYEIHPCDVGRFVAKEIQARKWIRKHPVLGYE